MSRSIFFDVYELSPGAGKSIGIYLYAKNLLAALLRILPEDTDLCVVCNPTAVLDFPTQGHPRARQLTIGTDSPTRSERLAWMGYRASRQIEASGSTIYFSPKGFIPIGLLHRPPYKRVVVVHDLIPRWYSEHFPGHFGRLEEIYINSALAHSVRCADRVIAISAATAADIERFHGARSGMTVVHNGLPPKHSGPRPVTHPKYIFAITSPLPHKNASGVLNAYQEYKSRSPDPLPLVVCGIQDPGIPGVTALRNLSVAELHGCYQHAHVFLFLSLAEGFGYPPLEAMMHDVPVVCSDIPVMREVTNHSAVYCNPTDPTDAALALMRASTDEGLRQALRTAGQTLVQAYSWKACATGVLSACLQ